MFRNNKLVSDFRENFNYLEIDKKNTEKVNEILIKAKMKFDLLEGENHNFFGFYLYSNMKQAQNILKVYEVRSFVHRKSTSFFGESHYTKSVFPN